MPTGLSAKTLWWAYLETARRTNRVSAALVGGSIDGALGRRQQVRYARSRLKLRGVLTAKLDADAQERAVLRLQLTGAQDAVRMVMAEFRAYRGPKALDREGQA